ncbi:copper transporter complex subunit Ctr4 [Marasmius crinis-equi]|uniref:Copper transport protein n=1 Tax=Marasmius crinis-equi TaxID=585013 RepID=A0ABR3F9U3_9AGAR
MDWHIHSAGEYAGSLIGLFFLVILVEGVRRLGREYDKRIIIQQRAVVLNSLQGPELVSKEYSTPQADMVEIKFGILPFLAHFPLLTDLDRPTLGQQALRSLFHTVQFGAGYMLMLLAMYYNGGVILAIFVGAYAGHFLTGRDTLGYAESPHKEACCGA